MSSAPNKPGEVAGERKKKESILDIKFECPFRYCRFDVELEYQIT